MKNMMKTPTKFIALLSGAALLASSVFAVSTNPVGYITITLNAESDNAIGFPMQNAPVFSGSISDITSNVITFHGSPGWTVNEFTTNPNFLQISTGVGEGMNLAILSNTADALTVDLAGEDLSGILANAGDASLSDQGDISAFWTPATLLPSTLPAGTSLLLYNNNAGINKSASTVLNYNGSNWVQGFSNADNFIIHTYESIICRLPAGSSDVAMTVAGSVPMVTHRLVMDNGGVQTDFRIYYNGPVGVTIGTSGLGFAAGDQFLVTDNAVDGVNKSATTVLNYNGSNWVQGFSNADSFPLVPGSGYIYRRAAGGAESVTWTSVPSYLAP